MPLRCRTCGMSDLRLSRVRIRDIGRVLALQYPVRCRTCRERSYVFILSAIRIKAREKQPRSAQSAAKGTWVE